MRSMGFCVRKEIRHQPTDLVCFLLGVDKRPLQLHLGPK